jgi:Fe-coproporphyrin III synthase
MYGDSAAASTWLPEVQRDQVSVEMWTALVDELASHGSDKTYLTIMGGEPLIHPKIVELVRTAKERLPGCNLDMSTNATLLARKADELVAAGIDDVYVSVDGPSPEINDPIRGRRAFVRAMEGLTALQQASRRAGRGPKIALNFVVTGMNYLSLPEMVRLCERLEVTELTVGLASHFTKQEGEASRAAFEAITGRPFTSWAGYCNAHQHANVDPKQLEALIDEATSMSSAVKVLVAPTRYGSAAKSRFFTDEWRGIVRETTCVKLWAQSTILPNGDVISCTTFADMVMGNLREQTLAEVFHGSRYARIRETLRRGLQPVCHRCCELNMDIDVDPTLYELETAPSEAEPPAPVRLRLPTVG